MDALIKIVKQNVIASALVGIVVLGFLGIVVIPGLTSGSAKPASSTPQTVVKEVVGSPKVEAQDTKPSSSTGESTTTSTNESSTTGTGSNAVSNNQGASEYLVKSGDTLGAIAAENNTTVDAIVALNGLVNENAISIGQKLKIPGGSSITTANSPTPKPTNASVSASTPNTPNTPVSTSTPKPTNTPGVPTSTPTPKATNTPKPTNTAVPPTATPKPAVDYIVKSIYRLNDCENHGMLRTKIWVLDKNGNPLDGIKVVRYTDTGDFAGSAFTGDKGPGICEFDNSGPGMGGNWHATIEMPGQTSATAWELRTDLGLDGRCETTGEPGSYFKHISYDVVFQKTN